MEIRKKRFKRKKYVHICIIYGSYNSPDVCKPNAKNKTKNDFRLRSSEFLAKPSATVIIFIRITESSVNIILFINTPTK